MRNSTIIVWNVVYIQKLNRSQKVVTEVSTKISNSFQIIIFITKNYKEAKGTREEHCRSTVLPKSYFLLIKEKQSYVKMLITWICAKQSRYFQRYLTTSYFLIRRKPLRVTIQIRLLSSEIPSQLGLSENPFSCLSQAALHFLSVYSTAVLLFLRNHAIAN